MAFLNFDRGIQKVGTQKKHPFRVFGNDGTEVTSLTTPTVKRSIDGALPVDFSDPEISTYDADMKRFLLTVPNTYAATAYTTDEYRISEAGGGLGFLIVDFVPDLSNVGTQASTLVTNVGTVDTVVDAIKVKTDALTIAAINATVDTALSDYYNPTETTTNVKVLVGTYNYRGTWYSAGDTFDCEAAQATRDIALGYLEAT